MPPALRQFGGYFLWALGLVVAASTLYEVGKVSHQPLLLPGGVAVAVLLALLRYSLRWVPPIIAWRRERARMLAEYPDLVAGIETLKTEKAELDDRLKILGKAIGRSYRSGLREGHAQFIGAYNSREINPLPTITSVALNGEKLQLTCQVKGNQKIWPGTRFSVIQIGTGQLCGVIGVIGVSEGGQTFTAEVIDEAMPAFWTHIKERADHDFSPPQLVTIQRYVVPPVPAEEQQ